MINYVKTTEEFNKLIQDGECLIDFFATWCGPCKMLTPVLEEIDATDSIKGVKIIKVDIDLLPELANKYSIQAVPTLFYLKNGEIKNTTLGFLNKSQLIRFVEK